MGVLAQVLDDAVDHRTLQQNPARGRRRRMKVPRMRRNFLERDMVVDLLDEAGRWEQTVPPHQRYGRRALLAVLWLAGPRISEALSAPRARLDIHRGRLEVGDAKTPAGLRDIELSAFCSTSCAVTSPTSRHGTTPTRPSRSSRREPAGR